MDISDSIVFFFFLFFFFFFFFFEHTLSPVYYYTRVVQKVLSLIGFLGFIPGIFQNASLHLNGVSNS